MTFVNPVRNLSANKWCCNFYPINLGILQLLEIVILSEEYGYYLSTYLHSIVAYVDDHIFVKCAFGYGNS